MADLGSAEAIKVFYLPLAKASQLDETHVIPTTALFETFTGQPFVPHHAVKPAPSFTLATPPVIVEVNPLGRVEGF